MVNLTTLYALIVAAEKIGDFVQAAKLRREYNSEVENRIGSR